jgi:FAD:protein FMN transferase
MLNVAQSRLIKRGGHLLVGSFRSMASPCELLLDTTDIELGHHLLQAVIHEVRRIEQKFSRYLQNSCISQIALHAGTRTRIDAETYRLFAFADQLYQLSDGMFDITSGVLRKAWSFDGQSNVPSAQTIESCLPLIGWNQVEFSQTEILLPKGMELDLGGIGKEYAVDRAFAIVEKSCNCAFVVNLGGDLRARGPRHDTSLWSIGIENPSHEYDAKKIIQIGTSSVATSGDSKKFLESNGVRYGHLLNPKTGWPVQSGVRTVTVAADTCTTAGMLTSLSLLAPTGAIAFLEMQENIVYWTT